MSDTHPVPPAVLEALAGRFAPINAAARAGSYIEAFGNEAAAAAYLDEERAAGLVQSILKRLQTGPQPEAVLAMRKPKPRPDARPAPKCRPFKPR